ncbi:MAG: chemotaxis protein CheW [Nitrospirota bacterium]
MPSITEDNRHDNESYLVFTAANQLYALSYHDLLQILDAPVVTSLPLAPPSVRGVIDVQGATVPLIDLRILLGSASLREEIADLVQTVAARRQDHVNWLTKLKDAVYHDKEIMVQTDPHKCNFGLWYDRYETSSATFTSYMQRFDNPHQAVHRIAIQAKELMARGQMNAAKELVHDTENTILKGLLALFDGFEVQLKRHTHEYAIVLQRDGRTFALVVDSLVVFDTFAETVSELPLAARNTQANFVTRIGRLAGSGTLNDVLILDPDLLHTAALS